MLSEQAVLSPRWPHPFKIILSPKSSVGVGVLNGSRRTWTLLGRGLIFLFLSLQGRLPGNGGHGSRVSVLEGTHWHRPALGAELLCLYIPLDLRVGL